MAEHNDTATEKPTDKKISDAHKKGQFAQAPEIQVVFGLIASYFVILFTLGNQANYVTEFTVGLLGNLEKFTVVSDAVPHWIGLGFLMLFGLLLPIIGANVVACILAGGLQSGFKTTPEVIGIKFDKLNPISGFKRVFSKQGIVKMFIDLGKVLIVAGLI